MNSKIINFSDILLQSHEQKSDRDAILDVVVLPAITEIIRKIGLEPLMFFSDDVSLKKFMECPLTHREEDNSFCSVFYDCCTKDTLYRAECKITFEGECVVSETDIYKLDNYRGGNRVWLWFNGVDWEQGPGENYFDIEDVMHK